MISINSLTVAFGGFTLLDSIDFHISENDKIGLVGKNGAGKSTVMKLICGLQSPTSGSVDMPNDLRIGYLPQIMEHHKGRTVMEETLTAFDRVSAIQEELDGISEQLASRTDYESEAYLSLITRLNDLNDSLAIIHSEPPEVLAEKTLLGLGFKDSDFGRKTETFSQGWNMRIELAKILLSEPDVLLLDEPTNHLDMPSKDVLKEAIKAFDGTAIIVSHDREFLDGLVTKVYEFGGGRVREHLGGIYDFLRSKKISELNELGQIDKNIQKEKSLSVGQSVPSNKNSDDSKVVTSQETLSKTLDYAERKEQQKRIRRIEKCVKESELKIEKMETRLKELDELLMQPENASDMTLVMEYTSTKKCLDEEMDHWEKLNEELAL